MDDDDALTLRASLEDDPARFGVLFHRHHDRIWGFLARTGGRPHADELAGDVFVTAFARRAAYDPTRGTVLAWLYGIARNVQRTRLRSEGRRQRAFERALAMEPRTVPDDAPELALARRELAKVRAALARLPERDREVIVLYAWEELGYEAIAAVLEVEVGTVRSRLSRARGRLRELLEASGQGTGMHAPDAPAPRGGSDG